MKTKYSCVIAAAGFANRLGNLVHSTPKALLELSENLTILDHMLSRIEEISELGEIVIVTNEFYKKDFLKWKEKTSSSKNIKIISNGVLSKEESKGAIKDTLFGISNTEKKSGVLIMGSDNFIPDSLKEASNLFLKSRSSLLLACDYGDKKMCKRFLVPVFGSSGRIIEIEEKPKNPKTTFISPFIYFIKNKDLCYLEELASQGKDNIGHLLELINKKSKLKGCILKNQIIDVGTPKDYEKAKEIFRISLQTS